MTHNGGPFPPNSYYWPDGLPRNFQLSTFVELFRREGYEKSSDGSLEVGKEKIVIYTNDIGSVLHAARQLSDGMWTSKMGPQEDIRHETPLSLSVGYGQPAQYMERAIKPAANDEKPAEIKVKEDN